MSQNSNRITIYIRPRKDKDIADELTPVDEGDRSWYVRELVRDGLRYRALYEKDKSIGLPAPVLRPEPKPVEPVVVTSTVPDFSDITITKVEYTDAELDSRLDKM